MGHPLGSTLGGVETTVVQDVELVSVGMEWPSANGPITFTFEHLNDAMVAANEDPHVVPPRLKIGHSDPRFADPDDPGHDPFYDGEPALGSVRNLRLVNDGATLIGDYVEVPVWLAEAMPTAYPSRSIEGAWAARTGAAGEPLGSWDVETPGGKKYSFVLTACALLGLSRPAVEDLEDLERFVVEGKGIVIAGTAPDGGEAVAATIGAVPVASRDQKPVDATASIDHVIGSFYDEHEEGHDTMYWWWVRDAWTDPNFLVVDDDEGGLWKVPFTSDDNQVVAFTEPEKALQTFVPAPAEAAALSLRNGAPIKHFANAAASRAAGGARRGSKDSANIFAMDLTSEQRTQLAAKLGLEEDANEETILDALLSENEEETETEETTSEETEETTEEESTEVSGPVASASSEGSTGPETVTVDKGVWDKLQHDVARLAKQDEVRVESEREARVEQAVAAGKILPASRKDWLAKMKAAPEATASELEQLAPGLVPTPSTEVGTSTVSLPGVDGSDPELAAQAYISQHFPHLAASQEG